ncbi:3043_t:CDS:2 [Ambispora leptoticha]|uniref:3043_t:CDS:1 n=1 Tax=Ambispora leptoticha TaxID=144679 RepID=A0A9N8ZBU9_9GLOM|nr:3043_t:CDS:2 [Ambispora leptoticha]
MAVLSIQVDNIDQDVEIVDLEEKLAKLQHTIDQFQSVNHNNVLKNIGDTQYKEDNSRIKEATQQQTNHVLDDLEWAQSYDSIYRVLNIESYIDGNSLQLPTRDDIQMGERELNSIQAKVDHLLPPRIETLDEMISNLIDGGTNFIQQRESTSGTSKYSIAISNSIFPTRQSPSPTPRNQDSLRRPPIRLLPHTVNNYIPKSNDPLDVEVARIVNACPVKIKVTLVEGAKTLSLPNS